MRYGRKVNCKRYTHSIVRSGDGMLKAILVITIVLLLALCAFGIPPVTSDTDGGCWLAPRTVGMSASMGTNAHSVYSIGSIGSALLSSNYYTIVAVDTTDSCFTYGMGDVENGYYSPDSSGCDTTALYLDGFVTNDIQISMFFMGTAADTFMITVEQALRYDAVAGDSGFAYGFYATDTLFTDYMNATRDTCMLGTVSSQGDDSRLLIDSFELIAPCTRIKIVNMGAASMINANIDLYARHTENIMSGGSSRLLREVETKATVPRGRGGLR